MINWLLHVGGIDNVSGRWYAWWSGIGGDVTWLALPILLYRKHNCHARWCWRIGQHPVEGTPYLVCRKHHPDLPDRAPTAEDLR